MSTRRMINGGIAAVSLGLIALAPSGFASGSATADGFSVVTASQHVAPAQESVRVPVIVRSPDAGLLCKPVHVVVTYWGADGIRRHVATDRPSGAVESAMLTIPASRVQAGLLRYTVVASQGCGLFDASTDYYGRAPQTGSYALRVLPMNG